MIRLVIADDHAVLRQGLTSLLMNIDDLEVVGEAGDGSETIEVVQKTQPDVVVLDISMPGPGLLQMLEHLRRDSPKTRILILSTHAEDQYAIRALRAGADGYLTKERSGDDLATAVRHVANGRKYISPALAEQLATELVPGLARRSHEELSDREFQVFVRLGRGLSAKETAAELSVSPKTVHSYRARIFEKTGLTNDAEIVRYAVQNKLVD
jgi:two-component system, NarL family, invasion response regulator UvrY